jgi:hypothetical protein
MAPLPSPRERARNEFDLYVEIFEQTKDKAACWAAFAIAREHGFDIPAKINAEIDRFAGAIADAAFRRFGRFAGVTDAPLDNEAVGRIWKNSKKRDPGTGISMSARSYDIAVAVARYCALGASKTKAVERVVEEHHTNKTTVWNALKAHPYVSDMGPDELGLPFPDLLQRSGGS